MSDQTHPSNNQNPSPEALIPRLGDYLVEEKLITPEELEAALAYQKKSQGAKNPMLLGQALVELDLLDRQVLDQAISVQLAGLHEALKTANLQLEQRVHHRTKDLERRVVLIRTAAEISQMAVNATSLSELLQRTLALIVERFDVAFAAVYLVDETYTYLLLSKAAGAASSGVKEKNQRILIGSRSLIGWVAANNEPRLASDIKHDFLYNPDELLDDIEAEVAIPITVQVTPSNLAAAEAKSRSDLAVMDRLYFHRKAAEAVLPQSRVLGVLDVQHTSSEGLDSDAMTILQVITNHLASVIQNIRLLEATRISLNESAILYDAGQEFAQARKDGEIFRSLYRAISKIGYPTMLLVIGNAGAFGREGLEAPSNPMEPSPRQTLRKYSTQPLSSPRNASSMEPITEPTITVEMAESVVPVGESYNILDTSQPIKYPGPILTLPMRMKSSVIAFVPIRIQGRIQALIVIGLSPMSPGQVNKTLVESEAIIGREAAVQTCSSLANMAADALGRVLAVEVTEKRVAALQSFSTISSIISMDIDLANMYKAIHTEVKRIIGDVNFLIALYDATTNLIQVPYLYETSEGKTPTIREVPPFPLGEGLTSIVINSHKPLILVENADVKARQLGAKTVGRASKSWLGVPLMVAGEVIGAIVVQDLEQEHRFDEDDEKLLATIGSQVAIAIRTAQLLETARHLVERQRLISEITAKIRSSNDMETIIQTTTQELRRALGAGRIRLELGVTELGEVNQPPKKVRPARSKNKNG